MSNPQETFVRESEEGITKLNNALLDLETDPDDDDAMESIFRTAHTLKGNAAAMGFDGFSGLAHAMEDLLDEVRDDEIPVTPELMDLLFEAVDALDAMLGEIGDAGQPTTDPGELEDRLRAIADGEASLGADDEGSDGDASGASDEASEAEAGEATDEASGAEAGDTADGTGGTPDGTGGTPDGTGDTVDGTSDAGDETGDATDGEDGPTDASDDGDAGASDGTVAVDHDLQPADDEGVYRAEIDMGDADMPGVDAMFVLEAAEEAYAGLETRPDRATIEDGAFDETFTLVVRAANRAAVADGLAAVNQVESVDVATVAPAPGEASDASDADAADTDASDADAVGADDATSESSTDAGDTSADATGTDSTSGTGDTPSDAGTAESGGTTDDGDTINSVRVDVEQLDDLYGLVEQLVTSRIKLRREMEEAGIDSENLDELDKISSNLQNTVMDMRLIPLSAVVDTFPRLVRDLARDQDKQVDFSIDGRDIELDRTILTEIRDPLVHILRNAVDHGVEPPEERAAAGKPETGSIELRASRERDHVNVVVEDDGGGIDADTLRKKAVDEGVKTPGEVEAMTDKEARELIFHPGLSTNDEVTDVSGRGVGMDVVRTTVKELDGQVDLYSTPGEGTRIELQLPVTVAIVRVMFVSVDGTEYGVPIKNIAEVTRATDVEVVNDQRVVRHDDDLYPVIDLTETLDTGRTAAADGGQPDDPTAAAGAGSVTDDSGFGFGGTDANDGMLVRVREDTRQVALQCDEVLHQEEVVVKPLEGILSGIPGLSGTAVLGDGDVVSILDVETLGGAGV